MERLVLGRLKYFSENERVIPSHQYRLRRHRSVLDCVSISVDTVDWRHSGMPGPEENKKLC